MLKINQCEVPTCRELAARLAVYGDRPLFSGYGWYAVLGFWPNGDVVQVNVRACPPDGHSAKESRNSEMP